MSRHHYNPNSEIDVILFLVASILMLMLCTTYLVKHYRDWHYKTNYFKYFILKILLKPSYWMKEIRNMKKGFDYSQPAPFIVFTIIVLITIHHFHFYDGIKFGFCTKMGPYTTSGIYSLICIIITILLCAPYMKLFQSEIDIFNKYRYSVQFQNWVRQISSIYLYCSNKDILLQSDFSKKHITPRTKEIVKNAVRIYKAILNKKHKKLKIYNSCKNDNLQLMNILYQNGHTAGKKLQSLLKCFEKYDTSTINTSITNTSINKNTDIFSIWYNKLSVTEQRQISKEAYEYFAKNEYKELNQQDINLLFDLFLGEIKKDFEYLQNGLKKHNLALNALLTINNLSDLEKAIPNRRGASELSELPEFFIAQVDQTINDDTISSPQSKYSLDNNQFLILFRDTSINYNIVIYELQAVNISISGHESKLLFKVNNLKVNNLKVNNSIFMYPGQDTEYFSIFQAINRFNTLKIKGLKFKSLRLKSLKLKNFDSKSFDFKNFNSKNLKFMNFKPMSFKFKSLKFKNLDFKSLNFKSLDSKSLDFKLKNLEFENLRLEYPKITNVIYKKIHVIRHKAIDKTFMPR